MTEKIARRGTHVRTEYSVDVLDQLLVKDFATRAVVALLAAERAVETRAWILSNVDGSKHTGFPVVEDGGELLGVLTRRDLLEPLTNEDATLRALVRRPPAVIEEGRSLREAADRMVELSIGRLVVVAKDAPSKVVGILTRSDLLAAHKQRIADTRLAEPSIILKRFFPRALAPVPRV